MAQKKTSVVQRLYTTYRVVGIAITIVAAIVGFYYLNGLQDAHAEDVRFENFDNIGVDGFDMKLSANIVNPSRLDVRINSIEYKVFLKDTGLLLTEGELEGVIIRGQKTTHIEVQPRVFWRGGASALAQYLVQDRVLADVEVKARLFDILPAFSFKHTVDIKPALDQMQNRIASGGTGGIEETENIIRGLP